MAVRSHRHELRAGADLREDRVVRVSRPPGTHRDHAAHSQLLLGLGDPLIGRLLAYDALEESFRTFKVNRDPKEHALPRGVELKLFTAQKDLVDDKVGSIRFYPDGGSNGGRITVGSGERKYEVDVDWLTGRVAILD